MSKKRAARSDNEEDEDVADDDQVMNGNYDEEDEEGDGVGDSSSDNEKMADSEEEKKEANKTSVFSPRKTRRERKRRRGLTPPPDSQKKKAKRARTSANATSPKPPIASSPSSSQTKAAPTNGDSIQPDTKEPGSIDSKSPAIAPDRRRIAYDIASAIPPSIQEHEDDESTENGASDELNLLPPTIKELMNGTSQNADDAGVDQPLVLHEATAYTKNTNGTTENNAQADPDEQSASHDEIAKQPMPQENTAEEKVESDEALEEHLSDGTKAASTGISRFERLAIFVLLGFLSLLVTMPQVIKLSQVVVPLDDSILPQPPKLPKPPLSNESEDKIDEEEEDEEEEEEEEDEDDDEDDEEDLIVAAEERRLWNKHFSDKMEDLSKAKEAFSSRHEVVANYYKHLMDRIEDVQGEVQTKQNLVGAKLKDLNLLENLITEETDNSNWEETRELAQRLLGRTLFTTSSIPLWNVPEHVEVDCGLEDVENHDGDDDYVHVELPVTKPLLTEQLLEQKESALLLRSTITAEKFIGGDVAKQRIRSWVRTKISTAIVEDEEMTQIMGEIDIFAKDLTEFAANKTAKDDDNSDSSDSLDLLLTELIQKSFDTYRADLTGVFDHASLKNGAEIIYGGKRGTSKSLIDSLPIMNRVLQSSNLRFYGFGPEAALTPTFPPNTIGQCWAFQRISLKEQLKERELFESQYKVPNDFKRGNFGTLTIRLPSPIWVDSIIIEHPPIHLTDQAGSAIRSFRVVGYEDKDAATKAWSLGSFEYDLVKNKGNNQYLQEFEVANTVYGKEIPSLRSISLAIDSNYGHDYACLYRFRVHGIEEEE